MSSEFLLVPKNTAFDLDVISQLIQTYPNFIPDFEYNRHDYIFIGDEVSVMGRFQRFPGPYEYCTRINCNSYVEGSKSTPSIHIEFRSALNINSNFFHFLNALVDRYECRGETIGYTDLSKVCRDSKECKLWFQQRTKDLLKENK